ncbi:MAG TPA: GNAT family N-acetyltransferase [Thermoplasmata archaeon]|nr:GNAT family N-acetyltransferase [Thermoplasmata archaeon]
MASYRRRYSNPPAGLDIAVQSIEGFEHYADLGTPTEWDGPAFAHLQVPIDRTGRIASLARAKAWIPRTRVRASTAEFLDGYVNALYRSLKNFREGSPLAGQLEAARSVQILIQALFGSEGRRAPYAKYLEWELDARPLRYLPWPSATFRRDLGTILMSGNVRTQRTVFRAVERSFRKRRFGRVFDGWGEEKLRFLRGTHGGRDRPPESAAGPLGDGSSWGVTGGGPNSLGSPAVSTVRIREFTEDDRPFVVSLARADLTTWRRMDQWKTTAAPGDADKWFDIGKRKSWSNRTCFLIAEVDGEFAGFVIAGPDNDTWTFRDEGRPKSGRVTAARGEIYELSVAKRFRRKGVATALMKAAERDLRLRGYRAVVLGHLARNLPAQRLYASLGYHANWVRETKRLRPSRRRRSSGM